MPLTKKSLQERYESFINTASDSEIDVMERMLSGWEKKRDGEYDSFIGSWLQPRSHWEENTLVVTIPNHKGLENILEITHGGVTATLLDNSMGIAADTIAPEGYAAVTLEMKINFMKPGKGNELRCEASILSHSRKTAVTSGSVYREDGTQIAHATATFYFVRH
ncbi:PaaI family thioesterase [Alteribacillus iranensis]|uniref:Uncharacterized domain 1-containing protein n=1 Tax=Alteribacillus iranensis TaxID=930128 RepID=A0A1I2ADI4_9BACI|nr:PaaI family thioesterase [Alteribacillus iranensis]SFE42021.1 uncharacterized domain 1-containing protein [Alteribacillus iranensis]